MIFINNTHYYFNKYLCHNFDSHIFQTKMQIVKITKEQYKGFKLYTVNQWRIEYFWGLVQINS